MDDTNTMNHALTLPQLLRRRCLTQSDLARKLRVCRSAVCQWVSGAREPSRQAAVLIGVYADASLRLNRRGQYRWTPKEA